MRFRTAGDKERSRVLEAPEGSSADIILKDGDELVVPKRTQEVTVIGEVPTATSHVWNPDRTLEDYVARRKREIAGAVAV